MATPRSIMRLICLGFQSVGFAVSFFSRLLLQFSQKHFLWPRKWPRANSVVLLSPISSSYTGSRGVLRQSQECEKGCTTLVFSDWVVGDVSPKVHRKYMSRTRFSPFYYLLHGDDFKVKCYLHTHLFWYHEQASIRPYWFKRDPPRKPSRMMMPFP